MSEPPFLQHLKERKLVQWGLAYLAGAWVLFEVSDAVGGRLGWPDGLYRGLLVLLAVGFFVTLVLAWYHGEKGRQRASGAELLMVAALLVVAGVALSRVGTEPGAQRRGADRAADDRPIIAVLPLDNFSPDPAYDFFAAGVQEDLTTKLQRIPSVAVISRTSVEQYRDRSTRPSLRQIADELGADYLLEGSARIMSDSVRITAQLVRGATDTHLWAEDYDAPYSVESYVRLQSEIVQRIASDLRAAIAPRDMAWLETVPTRDLRAYEVYMKGNEAFFEERLRGFVSPTYPSIQLYEEALERDPRFALAHAALALDLTYASDAGEREHARESAERALSLAGEIPEARLALTRLYAIQGNQEEADRQLELAAATAPEHSLVVRLMAAREWRRRAYDTAILILSGAERLDPRDPLFSQTLGERYLFLHRYDEALDAFRKEAAKSSRRFARPSSLEAYIHLARGERDQARTAISGILGSDEPDWPYTLMPTNYSTVVRRVMTAEERQVAFDAYAETARGGGEPFYCSQDLVSYCLRRAIHETEVGSPEKARAAWDSLNVANSPSLVPSYESWQYTIRALVYMLVGENEAAIELARMAVDRFAPEGCRGYSAQIYVCPTLARVLAHFGEYDEAMDLLEVMLPAPSRFTVHILEIDPIWDPLRAQPRFQALLERYRDDVEH